jgi:predicted  nucleic acid-binding Zn-ribbon protein
MGISVAGRTGITYEQVTVVAEDLLRNKINPTIDKIRAGLGNTGSNLTISRHLNEWRNTRLPEIINNKLENLAPPDSVNLAVKGVWEKLKQAQVQELERLQAAQAAEVTELKGINHQLNDALGQALKRIEELSAENVCFKTTHDQMQKTLEEEKKDRFLAQGALTACQNHLEQQMIINDELKTEHTLAITELKGVHTSDLAVLQEGLNVAKDAMEDYRTRYAVDVDNLKIKKEQLEKQVFDLSLARRDAEIAKQRLKQDLELSQKELDTLRQEDKLNKNTKAYLEEELKNTRAEIARLNRLLEALHHRQSTEVDGLAALSKRHLNIEKKFEKV